jgi:ATP-dependent DNA helicase RecG
MTDLETGRFAARRYRNRRIGEFLKELKLTEGRGTGIPKILKAMKANGSPKPRFETDDDRTYFIATFPIHVQGKIKGKQGQAQVTGEVLKFLAILNSPLTRMEIQKALGLKGQANFRDRYLRPSIALGVVEMTIPEKPNSRFQRYRITDKGRQLIKAGDLNETRGNKKLL